MKSGLSKPVIDAKIQGIRHCIDKIEALESEINEISSETIDQLKSAIAENAHDPTAHLDFCAGSYSGDLALIVSNPSFDYSKYFHDTPQELIIVTAENIESVSEDMVNAY